MTVFEWKRRVRHFSVAAGVALVVASCVACHPGSLQAPDQTSSNALKPPDPNSPVVIGDGDVAFPGDSLTDWVSYGDAAVFITVTGETAEQPDDNTQKNGEGLIGRSVSVTRGDIVWQRNPTLSPPASFTLGAWGWTVHAGERKPTVTLGASRMEVGHRYFVVVTNAGTTPGWTTIGDHAIVPADGQLGQGERVGASAGGNWDTSAEFAGFNAVVGKTTPELIALLTSTVPDPLAVKYQDLPPAQRFKKVAAER